MKRLFALLLAVITLASLCLTACEDAVEPGSSAESSLGESSIEESSGKEESSEPEAPPIEPAYCTVISTGVEYTVSNAADSAYADSYGKELTDGIIADTPLSTDWHAYHHSLLDSDGKMSVTIDLGEVRNDLTHFYAHFDNRLDYGIGSPTGINLYISEDGRNFRLLTTPLQIMDSKDSCIKYETAPVTARYVKMSFGVAGGNFVFCSEFLVGVKEGFTPDTSAPEESKPEESTPEESAPEESAPADSQPETSAPAESSAAQQTEEGNTPWLWIAIVAAVIVLAVVLLPIFKKKKA